MHYCSSYILLFSHLPNTYLDSRRRRKMKVLAITYSFVPLQFPATFRDTWELAYAQGVVQMWFKDGYVGTRGRNVRFRTPTHRAAGGFAITRPEDRRVDAVSTRADGKCARLVAKQRNDGQLVAA